MTATHVKRQTAPERTLWGTTRPGRGEGARTQGPGRRSGSLVSAATAAVAERVCYLYMALIEPQLVDSVAVGSWHLTGHAPI